MVTGMSRSPTTNGNACNASGDHGHDETSMDMYLQSFRDGLYSMMVRKESDYEAARRNDPNGEATRQLQQQLIKVYRKLCCLEERNTFPIDIQDGTGNQREFP